ncbi:MAG: winged helix-turn-helix domain-containing protein [archaeon]
MNYDMFFSSPRWTILDFIAQEPSSPVEISKHIGTSVSYVSQQLKLLEAAGLVVKEKTGSAEKGKPRLVYSIAREILQLSGLMKGMPVKKHVALDEHHKTILRIWALENESLHYQIEKLYWKLEEDLKDVGGIFVEGSGDVLVVSDSKKARSLAEKVDGLKVKFVSESELRKSENLHAIYDPKLLEGKQLVKGGKK